jgi:hypothetical protein
MSRAIVCSAARARYPQRVDHDHAALGRLFDVDVVDADASAADHLQVSPAAITQQ